MQVPALASLALALLAPSAAAQVFVSGQGQIPLNAANQRYTEDVEFGDIDSDGDFDVAFANGGDIGNQQNNLWLNDGGLQGGTVGAFSDATVQRLPALSDASRDLEFVDYDDDGDPDLFVANASSSFNQGSRFWTNQGGEQGGGHGFFVDDSSDRWVDLGEAGSSVAASLILPDGTFIAWSLDGDFADLDDDGDVDLVHSSYGQAFNGNVPTRVFLNDGDGRFGEFNPSGFQLSGPNIPNGAPALWSEGAHQHDTSATDGSQADVATSARGIELADIDGDLDVDLLLGSRNELPRFFENRRVETGALGFRDVTSSSYPAGYSPTASNYEQELGDLDNDGDVDLYGVDWTSAAFSLNDVLMVNGGAGNFVSATVPTGSAAAEVAPDFIDYDNDGDLDVYVSGFDGFDRVYRNDLPGLVQLSTAEANVGSVGQDLDAQVTDVDLDGDYDVMVGVTQNTANKLNLNATGVADTTAPALFRLEALAGHAATATADVVHVQVYDNAPLYVAARNATELELTVEGIGVPGAVMRHSGGQVFRAEVPGNLVGSVSYAARSTDAYGNSGVSATLGYVNTGPAGTSTGATTPSSVGTPTLDSLCAPIAGAPLYLVGGGVAPGSFGAFVVAGTASAPIDVGNGIVLNVGLPQLGDPIAAVADGAGNASLFLGGAPPVLAGLTVFVQFFAFDGAVDDWASSPRLELAFP